MFWGNCLIPWMLPEFQTAIKMKTWMDTIIFFIKGFESDSLFPLFERCYLNAKYQITPTYSLYYRVEWLQAPNNMRDRYCILIYCCPMWVLTSVQYIRRQSLIPSPVLKKNLLSGKQRQWEHFGFITLSLHSQMVFATPSMKLRLEFEGMGWEEGVKDTVQNDFSLLFSLRQKASITTECFPLKQTLCLQQQQPQFMPAIRVMLFQGWVMHFGTSHWWNFERQLASFCCGRAINSHLTSLVDLFPWNPGSCPKESR